MLFCVVYLGFSPRLANERLESGQNSLDKVIDLIRSSKFSMHDLSRCRAEVAGEHFRMNMPFEFGLDLGFRLAEPDKFGSKRFLIFEGDRFDLKKSLSDIAGQDVEFHERDFGKIIEKTRDFFRVEGGVSAAPGAAKIIADFQTFTGWLTEKKISEGHSQKQALNLPTRERLDEMKIWLIEGKPSELR